MIIGVIVDLAVGLLCIILGLMLWKKQKISLIHSYHYKNVKKEDVPAYTRLMGIGLILIGVGICITGGTQFAIFVSVVDSIARRVCHGIYHYEQSPEEIQWFLVQLKL